MHNAIVFFSLTALTRSSGHQKSLALQRENSKVITYELPVEQFEILGMMAYSSSVWILRTRSIYLPFTLDKGDPRDVASTGSVVGSA